MATLRSRIVMTLELKKVRLREAHSVAPDHTGQSQPGLESRSESLIQRSHRGFPACRHMEKDSEEDVPWSVGKTDPRIL